MRDPKFSILKAIAIVCVVISHAGVAAWLSRFVFIFHVPAFFLCAGYFFNTRYLSDERTFVVRRIKGLYLPFLRWSLAFLILHNLFFACGLLSETYGNAEGGVLHPYTWAQLTQRFWSIVCNMSGYDDFMCGTFWFFRALLLSSLAFLVAFKVFRRFSDTLHSDRAVGWAILATALAVAGWKVGAGFRLTGIAQGGYRELMGTAFMAAGFLIRQYRISERIDWRIALPALLLLCAASVWFPSSMTWNPTLANFFSLPIPAIAGFLCLIYISGHIDRFHTIPRKGLIYIGDRTLYIFAFHLLAFKAVSALKVAIYGLPWEAVSSYPVVHEPANSWWFALLYVAAGVGLPLGWVAVWNRVKPHIHFDGKLILRYLLRSCVRAVLFLVAAVRTVWRGMVRCYRGTIRLFKEIIAAADPKDE